MANGSPPTSCTPQSRLPPRAVPLRVRTARGYELELDDGRRLIDAISSWTRVPGSWPMRCGIWPISRTRSVRWQQHPPGHQPDRDRPGRGPERSVIHAPLEIDTPFGVVLVAHHLGVDAG